MKKDHPNFNRRTFLKGLGTFGAGAMVPLNQFCTNQSTGVGMKSRRSGYLPGNLGIPGLISQF